VFCTTIVTRTQQYNLGCLGFECFHEQPIKKTVRAIMYSFNPGKNPASLFLVLALILLNLREKPEMSGQKYIQPDHLALPSRSCPIRLGSHPDGVAGELISRQ
jgi:hypothetical protein